jgi:cobalt/nickel transport system permease protein
MSLIDELFDIEREAYRKSPIHSLDARIKLILCLLGLLVTVLLPYGTAELFAFLVIYMLFWGLYILSGSSLRYYLVRLLLIMPFGLFFIVLQPFFPNPYYEVYHVCGNPAVRDSYVLGVDHFRTVAVCEVCDLAVVYYSPVSNDDDAGNAGRSGAAADSPVVCGGNGAYHPVSVRVCAGVSEDSECVCGAVFQRI